MANQLVKKMTTVMGVTLLSVMFVTALVLTTDINFKLAGLDISIQNQSGRGVVVRLNGPECPRRACAAFALDESRVMS